MKLEKRAKLIEDYASVLQHFGFNASDPLYVSSGLYSYSSGRELWNTTIEGFKSRGLLSVGLHKEMYLSESQLESLSSEEVAAVDLMVLVDSQKFLGSSVSSFTFYVAQYRAGIGLPSYDSIILKGFLSDLAGWFYRTGGLSGVCAENCYEEVQSYCVFKQGSNTSTASMPMWC